MRNRLGIPVLVMLAITGCGSDPRSQSGSGGQSLPLQRQQATAASAMEGHILVTGIATLRHPTDQAVSEVLFPSVARHNAHNGQLIREHSVFIDVDVDRYKVVSTTLPTPKKLGQGQHHHVYFLARPFALRVENLQSGTAAPPFDQKEDGTGAHTDGNLYFITHLQEVNHKICKPALNVPLEARLVTSGGRFRSWLTGGSTSEFKENDSDQPRHKQCVAEIADWSFSLTATGAGVPELILETTGGNEVMRIAHNNAPITDPIVIVMGNAEESNITKVIEGQSSQSHAPDHHFDVYYDACDRSDLIAFPIPFEGSGTCQADTLPAYFPDWLHPENQSTARKLFNKLFRSSHPKIVGGFNCGPDQQP